MKRHLTLATIICAGMLHAHCIQAQQLSIQTDAGKQVVLGRNDIDALPRVKVTTGNSSDPVTFEGPRSRAYWKGPALFLGKR